jgi:hypothetical protein
MGRLTLCETHHSLPWCEARKHTAEHITVHSCDNHWEKLVPKTRMPRILTDLREVAADTLRDNGLVRIQLWWLCCQRDD